jgi:hypothetical protein
MIWLVPRTAELRKIHKYLISYFDKYQGRMNLEKFKSQHYHVSISTTRGRT